MKISGKTSPTPDNKEYFYSDIIQSPGIYRLLYSGFSNLFYIVQSKNVIMFDPDYAKEAMIWKIGESPEEIHALLTAKFERMPKDFQVDISFIQE